MVGSWAARLLVSTELFFRFIEHAVLTVCRGYGGRLVWARAYNDLHLIPLLEAALQALPTDASALRARLMARWMLRSLIVSHHMLDTQPAVYFVHYWGTGSSDRLAAAFRAALDQLARPRTPR